MTGSTGLFEEEVTIFGAVFAGSLEEATLTGDEADDVEVDMEGLTDGESDCDVDGDVLEAGSTLDDILAVELKEGVLSSAVDGISVVEVVLGDSTQSVRVSSATIDYTQIKLGDAGSNPTRGQRAQ